jgi:hypothetical protein
MCKEAAANRIGALACQVALPSNGRTAEGIVGCAAGRQKVRVDLGSGCNRRCRCRAADLHSSRWGPAFKIIDEIFMLALDNRETAMANALHWCRIRGRRAIYRFTDQILLRESPALTSGHWA